MTVVALRSSPQADTVCARVKHPRSITPQCTRVAMKYRLSILSSMSGTWKSNHATPAQMQMQMKIFQSCNLEEFCLTNRSCALLPVLRTRELCHASQKDAANLTSFSRYLYVARRLHAAISCCVFVVFGKQLLCIKRVFALTRAPASSPANDIGALLSVPRDDHGFLLPGSSRSGHATTFRASVSLSPIVRVDKLKPSMWALTRSRFDFAQMRIRNDARC